MLYTVIQFNGTMAELSLEALAEKIDNLTKFAETMEKEKMEKDEKQEAKKASDDKEDKDKMAKRATRDAAIKTAMDEKDEDKKDAAIKKATDEYGDQPHKNDTMEKASTEDKEEKEHIASLIKDKKSQLITNILTASKSLNPKGLKAVESRMKKASLDNLEFEWNIINSIRPAVTIESQPTMVIPPFSAIPFEASTSGSQTLTTEQLLRGEV